MRARGAVMHGRAGPIPIIAPPLIPTPAIPGRAFTAQPMTMQPRVPAKRMPLPVNVVMKPLTTVHISGLPTNTYEREFRNMVAFMPGALNTIFKREPKRVLGFVKFATRTQASAAIRQLDFFPFDLTTRPSTLLRANFARHDMAEGRPLPRSKKMMDIPGPKTCGFFGDSYISLFSLLPQRHVTLFQQFKGISAAEVSSLGNPKGAAIRKETERVSKQQRSSITYGVFGFGNVDVHLNYYYQKYEKDKPIDLASIANTFVGFVAGLPHVEKKFIIGAYADNLQDDAVRASLRSNGTLSAEAKQVSDWDVRIQCRQQRVIQFNACLAKACARYQGVNYLDVFDEMVNPHTHILYDNFFSENTTERDVRWQPTLLLWIRKMPWLNEIIDQDFLARLSNFNSNDKPRCEQPAKSSALLENDKAIKAVEPEPGARPEDHDQSEEDDQPEDDEQRVTHQQDDDNTRLSGRCKRDGSDTQSQLDSADDDTDSDDSDADGEYTL